MRILKVHRYGFWIQAVLKGPAVVVMPDGRLPCRLALRRHDLETRLSYVINRKVSRTRETMGFDTARKGLEGREGGSRFAVRAA
ncbi:hypothetical protein [Rhizobium giardinii]|jgi:hypothetical protein|uniref:Uncharacterized protein n=1 Tax=Rhizobium giardinii TaxID=56731 RepID=A0A7W8UCC0_9HYPH|nr:hypothetical protein [Rhizobium giardinii]MBB5536782.1 hypothetical protein [Rhizobium giardinii]